jgi:hypothetical protein
MLINTTDVVDGTLVSAIAATGRMLAGSASGLGSGRSAADLDIARWFDTYQLTRDGPLAPEDLMPLTATQIRDAVRQDDVQAVLQELLAARLTDAPEADVTRIRAAWDLSFAREPGMVFAAKHSGTLFDYYDNKIGELVARLEASSPPALTLIRQEAHSARLIAVVNAIERHAAALSGRPDWRTEKSFLASYRRHLIDQHGKLEPPDFDRRRRVPIADIYVPTSIAEEPSGEQVVATGPIQPPSLNVFDLAMRLDRTVLMGDPGGGKTTAANVLMHHFASDEERLVPFLVTLRDYAAKDPPEYSVVGHIERKLDTFYQCPAPPGLINLLLLTGRATVIFDGLDELLDTERRADIATRVEHFCREYPQAPVLVTSRTVGYDQARLDDRQFTCYRLGGFAGEEVAQYARKWFAQDTEAGPGESEAFLAESQSIPDLRSNPLLLSLMCILYRGRGSLPRGRAGVYEECAKLLFHRWDARRRIHQELRAGRLIEPALRHLAWWLFTREETQAAVTERQLVAETTTFLRDRGFESEDDARDAAREFVQFCRGRMWVFSDAGTTSEGERLYAFTHRTFLEYFAAAQLAYDSDSPELLAQTLAPHIAHGDWEVVGELAVQIKDGTSTGGARRVYEPLLDERRRYSSEGSSRILQFLARTLRSVDPSPQTTRRLTKEVLHFLLSGPDSSIYGLPLTWLLASCHAATAIADEEVSAWIAALVASDEPARQLTGLKLAVSLDVPLWGTWKGRGPDLSPDDPMQLFWRERSQQNAVTYRRAIVGAAADYPYMRRLALINDLITVEQALDMHGGLLPLLQTQRVGIFGLKYSSQLVGGFWHLRTADTPTGDLSGRINAFTAVGRYLSDHPQLPWTAGKAQRWSEFDWSVPVEENAWPTRLDPLAYLGAAGTLLISAESDAARPSHVLTGDPSRFGQFRDLYAYIEARLSRELVQPLPDLPLPDDFKQVFRDWAENKINFTAPGPDNDLPFGAPGSEAGPHRTPLR